MLQKIIDGLKQKYFSLGLAEDIIKGQAETLNSMGFVTDENLNQVLDAQKTFLTNLQKGIDKRVNDAVAKVKPIEKKEGETKPGEGKEGETEPGKITIEAIKALIEESIKPISETITKTVQQTELEKRTNAIIEKFKEYGLPSELASKFNIPQDADLDVYLKDVKQQFVNLGFEGVSKPVAGNSMGDDKTGEIIAQGIAKETKRIVDEKSK